MPSVSVAAANTAAASSKATFHKLVKAYRNILVVVKQTPYESYSQLKAQGKAPVSSYCIYYIINKRILAYTNVRMYIGCIAMGASKK